MMTKCFLDNTYIVMHLAVTNHQTYNGVYSLPQADIIIRQNLHTLHTLTHWKNSYD